jgi:hypothetical protein
VCALVITAELAAAAAATVAAAAAAAAALVLTYSFSHSDSVNTRSYACTKHTQDCVACAVVLMHVCLATIVPVIIIDCIMMELLQAHYSCSYVHD